MIAEALSTARDLRRMNEIATVLIRNGLGDIVRRIGLASVLARAGRAVRWDGVADLDKATEVRFREALEELGPTFVKFGQLLAGRADLLPPNWTAELSRLHEHAAPVPYDEVREQLIEDLGAPPEELFQDFDPEPLASASIAQIHRASLIDGTPVVIKVRRPRIRQVVEADLRLLTKLAERIEDQVPELRRIRPRSLARYFARSLRNELDLRIEARNAARLRKNLPDEPAIVIPRMFSEWTHERVCVMEFLDGPSVGEWARTGEPQGIDSEALAELGTDYVLQSIFLDGTFHADPHPGNLILLGDGRLGLIDFGLVGYLSETRRSEFLSLLYSVLERRVDEVVAILSEWSEGHLDMDLLAQDCAAFIESYDGLALSELDSAEFFRDLTSLMRENDLFMPHDLANLIKVFALLDGVGRSLAPDFVVSAHIEPMVRRAMREQHSPVLLARRGLRGMGAFLSGLPRDLRRLSRLAQRGGLQVHIDVRRLETFGNTIARSANRVTIGLVTAALIVGTSISLTVAGGLRIAGMPLFGFLGFTSSIAAGMWLVWSIARSGRD